MRHDRNPGDGYRAIGSRSSLEGPTKGPGFYNSEKRSFNRSFSHKHAQNHRRNFHCPPPAPPMPARANVFVEVGRLAAEYLVSRGVLPPGVLPAKCQNGSLKNPLSEFEEFRPHKEENTRFPGEARTSAFSRLGDTGFGGEPGRRKYNDDYGTGGPRNHARGKKKGGSSRNCGLDWGREYGRTGSWSDRHHDRTSLSMDLDRDGNSRRREEHPVGKDGGERMADDSTSRHHEENQFGKDDDRMDVDQETRSRPHEEQVLGKGGNHMSELTCASATPPQGVDNKDSESETKGQKIEELSEMKDPVVIKDTADVTGGKIKTHSLDRRSSQKMLDNKLRISGEATEVDLGNKGDIAREISDPSKDETVKEIISGDATLENFGTDMSLSEKSCTDLNALCKLAIVPTRVRSSLAKGTKRRSVNNFQLPEVIHEPHFMDTEEKQVFPCSFKTCDLNLTESSHGHDNQDRDAIFKYPTGTAVKKSASPIDINLSICNPVTSAENSKRMAGGKEVEIIDLEGDSAPEKKTLIITERRSDNAFMGLEEFSTPAPNTAEIPDSQDGYGLMISELLANDFPSVTPVPGDVNPLDNRGLHKGEVPLADDDPIYMSLGEIPFLRFLWNWENPAPQKDGKPF